MTAYASDVQHMRAHDSIWQWCAVHDSIWQWCATPALSHIPGVAHRMKAASPSPLFPWLKITDGYHKTSTMHGMTCDVAIPWDTWHSVFRRKVYTVLLPRVTPIPIPIPFDIDLFRVSSSLYQNYRRVLSMWLFRRKLFYQPWLKNYTFTEFGNGKLCFVEYRYETCGSEP